MLARKIASIHPVIVLVFWIALALASPILVMTLGGSAGMFVVNASTLVVGACWCGWMWAIRTAALEEASGNATPRRPWLYAVPLLAFLPFLILPEGALEAGGLLAVAANLAAILLLGSGVFLLWKTAEALERMVAPGLAPPKMKVFSTTVLLAMIYVAPFVVARRFAARARPAEAAAA
ncbi:hypothetical protein [Caulobacter sp. CCG-8]|uniref:hypothetical protein n=1 Tax=Caulobacter sp. CCG-8 TaxID=3127958 RepID=UPI00307D23E4